MGADGHIAIMDVEKFIREKGLSEKRFESFFAIIQCSTLYLQKFKSERVITDYMGDNLYHTSILRELSWHGMDKEEWDDFTYNNLIENLGKYEFTIEEFVELGLYLWDECHITAWEVWT